MNKHIIFLASLVLCFLATHNNYAMMGQFCSNRPINLQRIINVHAINNQQIIQDDRPTFQVLIKKATGQSTMVNVKYDNNSHTCTSYDMKDAAAKAFGLKPETFNIIVAGRRLTEEAPLNVSLPLRDFQDMACLHLVEKR